jgi:hypothetical protein
VSDGFVAREEERAFHGTQITAHAVGRASETPTATLDLTLKDLPTSARIRASCSAHATQHV